MRHLLGLVILLLLAGLGGLALRRHLADRHRRKRAAVRGLRIGIPTEEDDEAADRQEH